MSGFKLKVNKAGKVKVTDKNGKALTKLTAKGLEEKLKKANPKNIKVKMENEYTFIRTGSGVVCINGVWYHIP